MAGQRGRVALQVRSIDECCRGANDGFEYNLEGSALIHRLFVAFGPLSLPSSQPVEVIGQGSFGVVLLAEYRGTKVAIKRVLPLQQAKGNKSGTKSGSMKYKSFDDDMETQSHGTEPSKSIPPKPRKFVAKDHVKGDDSIEVCKSGFSSIDSGSAGGFGMNSMDDDDVDDLDFLGGLSFGGPRNNWAKRMPWLFHGRNEQRYNASILGTASGTAGTSKSVVAHVCPWFDENARRQQEFKDEMRLLSRLRHPCKVLCLVSNVLLL